MDELEDFYRNYFNAQGRFLPWEDLSDKQKKILTSTFLFSSWKRDRAIKEFGEIAAKVLKPVIESIKKIIP